MKMEEIYQTRGYRGLHRVSEPRQRIAWGLALRSTIWFCVWLAIGLLLLAAVFVTVFGVAWWVWGEAFLKYPAWMTS